MKLTIRNLKNRKVVHEIEIQNRGVAVIPRESKVEIVKPPGGEPIFLPFDNERHYIEINR